MVWSLSLYPDDAKQDPVVYGVEFGVVFLAKCPLNMLYKFTLDLRISGVGMHGHNTYSGVLV